MENMVGVVQGVKGRTIDIVYDLFFSDKRVVAAVVLYFSDLTYVYKKSNVATMLFGNLLGNREVRMRSLKLMDDRRQAFKDKTLDEILTLHRANMEIDYEDVVSVTVRKGLLETTLEFLVQDHREKNMGFWLDRRQIAEVEGLINRVLPDRVG